MGLPPTEREDAASTPERIGVYRIERRIGEGGMGEVFLAWDDRLERRVAIKRIRQDAGLSAEQRERFRREARLAARLSHSSVVQVHDLVTEGTDDAIVMEYVEGQTLAERLAAGRLEIGEALRIAREVAEGLAAAHEAGLIHRDLKAANVIVTRSGRAKILDFGLARPVERSGQAPITRQGFLIGTLHTMSPEQARGQEVDARSDLFSLGVLLFEMLTGRSPFRGADPVETLRRVVHEPPPDPRALRPELPSEVGTLLGRLLAKDRQDRPGSAAEVAETLERLRSDSGARPLLTDLVSVSDLPTTPAGRQPVPVVQPQTEPLPSSPASPALRRPRRLWTAAALLALLVAIPAIVFLTGGWPSRAPLRIAVAPVEVIPEEDERLALAGSGVVTALLSSLNGLQGLAPIDPRESARGGGSPVEMARVTAAREVLTAEVRRKGGLAQVTLSRIQGGDGQVLWTETFPVSLHSEGLANAVAMKVRDAYPDHGLRRGVPRTEAHDEDYTAFLEIQQRINAGAVQIEPELRRLEEVLRSSPRFLEAHLLAARLSYALFTDRRNKADLDRAIEIVRQARELSPEDPRPLRQEIQIALGSNRPDEASEALDRLELLLPGDPEILSLRARLAELQGRGEEAAALWAEAAEQVPSWQNLILLAKAEARRGRIDEARRRIETILRQAPDNAWAREALGEVELLYGDLERAEQIYRGLIPSNARRSLNNLGLALHLRGEPRAAAEAYRRSLAQAPDHVVTLVNLADVEIELGRAQEAEALYRRALDRLEQTESAAGLRPGELMFKAQCLVRLGRSREAVELAQAVLRNSPEDPYLLQQSALVHSLAGERTSAINNALAALDKGLPPRWFAGSAFRGLRESPELRSRLRAGDPY